MEEILASIRRIISEDDAPASDAEAADENPEHEAHFAPAPEPAPEPAPVHEDVLELTDRIEPEPAPAETVGDLDVYKPAPEPAPAYQPVYAPAPEPGESLISAQSAGIAASHFSHLTDAIAMPAGGRTLEDLTAELLRPLLKEWLDVNLPRIVEAKVAEEIERVSRTRGR